MFLTSLGAGLAGGVGFASPLLTNLTSLGEGLDLGQFARLADLLSQTPLDRLQPQILKEVKAGTSTAQLTAAGALANARAFGGEDYTGYHAFMALMPAYEISQSMSGDAALLPIMKVLYRSAARMQEAGRKSRPRLTAPPERAKKAQLDSKQLIARVHKEDTRGAEATFAEILERDLPASFEALIRVVCQEVDVHRVVLAWRGWDLMRLTGEEHAQTLLRQSVRQCVSREGNLGNEPIRKELPAVLAESGVWDTPLGSEVPDDAWIDATARKLADASRKGGASIVAEALKRGITTESIGQTLSLAATHLMLRQEGRRTASAGKPVGSVHGAGTGVHGSDTAAAWRGMARFGSPNQRKLALIAGGYHVSGQSHNVAKRLLNYEDRALESKSADELIGQLRECLQTQDQKGAAAASAAYGHAGHKLTPLLAELLKSSVAAEGALHAEKYYRTQVEAIEGDRPSLRPIHLAALGRVCASQSGELAVGRSQALDLLKSNG